MSESSPPTPPEFPPFDPQGNRRSDAPGTSPSGTTPSFDEAARRAVREAELLELIEDTLPPDALDRVLSDLAADPRLAAKVAAMHRDRALLLEADAPAPQGLVQAAMNQAFRSKLGPSAARTHTGGSLAPAAARTHPAQRSGSSIQGTPAQNAPAEHHAHRPLGRLDRRHLALAAGLALLVGGTGLLTLLATRPTIPTSGPAGTPVAGIDAGANVARNDLGSQPAAPNLPSTSQPQPDAGPRPDPLKNPLEEAFPADRRLAASDPASPPGSPLRRPDSANPPGPSGDLAVADAGGTELVELSQAVQLAREGKLFVRVISPSVLAAPAELAKLSKISQDERLSTVWALDDQLPVALARALPDRPWPESLRYDRTVIAADPAVKPPEPVDTPGLPDREGSARLSAYVARIRPSIEAFTSLREEIERRTGGRVEFVRLDALSSTLAQQPVTVTPEELLWWTQPPSAWSARVRVPVILEAGN